MWHNGPTMLLENRTYDAKAKQVVKDLAAELGFDLVGITSADPFTEAEQVTLERVRDGLMDGLPWYHAARVKRGCNPQEMLPGARSIIAVAMSYMAEAPPQTRRIDASARQGGPIRLGAGLPQGDGASAEAPGSQAF